MENTNTQLAPLRAETLAERLQTVAAWLDTLEGASTEEERLEIEAAMDGALRGAAEKVDNYVGLWQQIEMQAKLVALDVARLQTRKRVLAAWGDRMRANAFQALKESEQSHVKGSTHSLSIVKTPEVLEIYDGASIPRGLVNFEVLVEPDKERILMALRAGHDVPGARLVSSETVRKL